MGRSPQIGSENITASGKAGVGRLIQKLNALEELYKETETPFSGYPYSPFAPIADRQFPEPQTFWPPVKRDRRFR